MISIIVPVYNVESYLPKCLDSLINQTYKYIEIICINDGSKDDSLKILEEYAKKDSRIIIINRENRGISRSRNEALDVASGNWTMFVDSDDWLNVDICQKAVETAEKYNSDVVMWSYIREYGNKSLPKIYYPCFKIWEDDISELQRRIVGPINNELRHPDTMDAWGTIWGKLYRSSYISHNSPIKFVDTRIIGSAEDVLFNVEYMGRIKKAVYMPETGYHYRKLSDSYTAKHNPRLPEKWNSFYKEMNKLLSKQGLTNELKQAFENRVVLGLIGLGLNEVYKRASFNKTEKGISMLFKRKIFIDSIKKFDLRYLPAHWKVFFVCARYKMYYAVLIMLLVIDRIISR